MQSVTIEYTICIAIVAHIPGRYCCIKISVTYFYMWSVIKHTGASFAWKIVLPVTPPAAPTDIMAAATTARFCTRAV